MKLKAWITLVVIVLGLQFKVQAQYNSNAGRFQVNQIKGCAPFTVNITINAPSQCNGAFPCDMFFDAVNFPTNNQSLTFTHTYTQAGTYVLRVNFQSSGFDEIQITVTPNIQPIFETYTCGGNEVSVKVTDNNYAQYTIDFNDGFTVTVPSGTLAKSNHQYGSPGTKTISVRGRNLNTDGTLAENNCNPAITTVDVSALSAPTITKLEVLNNSSIKLDFSNRPNVLYRLEIAVNNASTFQLIKNVYNSTSETLTNLSPDNNYYCFRLVAFDPCNNITYPSSIICSSNFDLTIKNNVNDLSWSTNTSGAPTQRLNRSEPSGAALSIDVTNQTLYHDNDIQCGVEYCYQHTMNYPNGSQSISLEKCGVAISNDIPDAIDNISAVVSENNVALDWLPQPDFTANEYQIEKGSTDFTSIGTSTIPEFTDAGYISGSGACYKIIYDDVCGNESAYSRAACPIQLIGKLQNENVINLSWSAYTGWKNGVKEYVVEKYDQAGQLVQTFTPGTSRTLIDDEEDLENQLIVYVVRATANDAGLTQSVSNRIVIIKEPNLFYPSAFTPNGDNLNDIFNVFGHFIEEFEMNIYNRWGELMFNTRNLEEGWDGTYKGKEMPEGTYTFVAKLKDKAGRNFKRSGNILLLKKK